MSARDQAAAYRSDWRCDDCGETFTVDVQPVALDEDGVAVGPVNADVLIESMPCAICGRPMRRVVSAGDLRDWGAHV